NARMAAPATFASFSAELSRLVAKFEKEIHEVKTANYSDDESPYLFNVIPVEILGSVYERFLGKVVRPHGRGVTIEEKPEVRKAGGVYYTPRYIVDYIVEQTVGRILDDLAGVSGRVASTSEKGGAGFQPAAS